ncbi:MAG: hypothetical protein INR70_15435 [Parafilimonas terrae]|nr:hypothetical protein [Parafilimonas terrae]
MGLTAFFVFVVPWALAALLLTRAPTALRLGAPAAPWRPLPSRRDAAREERERTHPHDTRTVDNPGAAARDARGGGDKPHGGALGTSMEPTEPNT